MCSLRLLWDETNHSDSTGSMENTLDQDCIEQEYVFFLKLTSEQMDAMQALATTVIEQDQWSTKFDRSDYEHILRVRREIVDGKETLTQQTKTHLPHLDYPLESVPIEIDHETFTYLKDHAASGMVKTRYVIPVSGTADACWEVDVFLDQKGDTVPWVKVDIETKLALEDVPSFPFDYQSAVLRQPDQRTPEERDLVSYLFGTHYVVDCEAGNGVAA